MMFSGFHYHICGLYQRLKQQVEEWLPCDSDEYTSDFTCKLHKSVY